MQALGKHTYNVHGLEIDLSRECVRNGGEEMHLRRKSFQVLAYLLERRHRLVSKEELFGALWSNTAVTDDVLVQCVKEIRRVLGDSPQSPRFIKTVPRSGYRFVGVVEADSAPSAFTEEITRFEFELEEDTSGNFVPVTALPGLGTAPSRVRPILMACAALTIVAVAASYFFTREPGAEIRLPQTAGRETVAVMFLENASGDKELEWLSEGLADMLITNLSRSKHLTVLSRQQLSALLERSGYSGGGETIRPEMAADVGNKSGAQAIVAGRFTRLGEKVRIDVQIQDPKTLTLRAAESLTVDSLDDILTQVDILALRLARHLTPDEPESNDGLPNVMTNNLEAYRFYSLGMAKVNTLESREAIELLKKAVALDPEFATAHARIGYAYAVTWGQVEEGKPYLEKAFQLSSRTTERDRTNIAAWYAIANRDYDAAIRAYREIVKQQPLETEAYWRLARLLAGEEQIDEALDVLRRGIAVDPESKVLYNSLGGFLSSLGRHTEAITAHQRYLALAPNEANAYDSIGLTYQWAGDYQRARESFERALDINPDFPIAAIHLAHCQIRMGAYRSAIESLNRYLTLVELESEKQRAFDALIYIYLRLGDMDQAERAVTQRLANRSGGPSWVVYLFAVETKQKSLAKKLEVEMLGWNQADRGARGNLRFTSYFRGILSLNRGDNDQALTHFRDALGRRPPIWNFDDLEDCLGRAYLKLGRYDEAVSEFERVLQLSPNYPLARYHLAKAYESKGLAIDARREYLRFLDEWNYADADAPEVMAAREATARPSFE